jgi:two-component system NarL family sensor kinase
VLRDVAEALNRAPTEGQAATEALRRMADLLGVATGWVWLKDPHADRYYSAAVQSLPPYLQEPVRMTGRSCWCLELFRKGQLTARNIDVVECSRLAPATRSRQEALTAGLRCHASVPLYSGGQPLGVMNLAMRGWRRLSRHELDLLTTIADQLAVAIERARLGERLVARARTDERARIARDLHDTLAQGLTAVSLHLEAGLAGVPTRSASRKSLERALDVARRSLDEARRSIENLRPSALANRSLVEALAALARQFTADTGVRVRTQFGDIPALSSDIEREVFHIASEALANIRKHANAREVTLRAAAARHKLQLAITDDGSGFAVRGARGRGFGLDGIENRARAAGGRATIRSAPNRGTTVSVVIPLGRS